jgi:O-antigen/teichoic acid export membrane protein
MSSDNRLIVKNSLILYVKLFITSAIGIFTSRIVLQSLGASDYGLYNVVGGIVVLVNILNTSLTSTTYRYIAFEIGQNQPESINKVFNISLVLHGFMAVLVILFVETLGIYYVNYYLNVAADKIADAIFVLRMSVLAVVSSIFGIPFRGLLVATEKFAVQAIIEVTFVLIRIPALIWLYVYSGNQLRFYAILTVVISIALTVATIVYCRKKMTRYVQWHFQKGFCKYREMLGFSSWILIGALSCIGRIQGAALIINAFFGVTINASFAIANSLNQIVLMVSQNLGQAAIPQITKSYSGGNTERSMDIVSYISKYSFFLLMLPAIPILLETKYLLHLWLGVVPQYTEIFCKLIIINSLAECLGAGIPAMVAATGKIKWFQIIMGGISLLTLPIAYYCCKLGCPPHIILVVQIVIALVNAIIGQVLLKKIIAFDVKRFLATSYLRIAYVLVLVLPLFVIRDLFKEGLIRFIVVSGSASLWLGVTIFLVGMTFREREIVFVNVRRIFNQLRLRSGS